MAGARTDNFGNPQSQLSPTQQDLLLAALASNNPNGHHRTSTADGKPAASSFDMAQSSGFDAFGNPADVSVNPDYFASPHSLGQVNPLTFEQSPFDDLLDGDGLDFDPTEGGLMIGGLPGDNGTVADSDLHEKRKNPDSPGDEGEGANKKKENGEVKEAKKPGRKPLTSEPTTKRKAQNRAAQRAFRERKEKHLKDLENKVEELEKKSESANHENGLLRAQVTRLQTELREYRKRLSLGGLNRSPMSSMGNSMMMMNSANNFQFEFPRFGSLPGSQAFDSLSKSTNTSPVSTGASGLANGLRHASMSASPQSSGSPGQNNSHTEHRSNLRVDPTSAHDRSNGGGDNAHSQARVFRFNSSASSSDSPSASSVSQFGQNSSCGTSPEPSHNSPANTTKHGGDSTNLDTINEGYVCHGNPEAAPAAHAHREVPGFDLLASQNGGSFDPLLFGDYRESQAAIVGNGEDFSNGFFNDAFGFPDINSPFNLGDGGTGLTPAASTGNKPNPLEHAQKLQEGAEEDEVVPGEDPSQMLSCHKIWDKLQDRPDFKDGSFDIDGLCSELRAKARCSESGVVVDQKDVDAALKRLPLKQREKIEQMQAAQKAQKA